MNANEFLKKICPNGAIDEVTVSEIVAFAELKLEEADRIKGQIARDLSYMGEMAFQSPKAYDKLKAKYLSVVSLGGKKKIAILEQMRRDWCPED